MALCQIAHACEPHKSHQRRLDSGFYQRYLSGEAILDIGGGDGVSLIPNAITVDLDYPGYDGAILPFAENSQDAVFSSHCLEHVHDSIATIKEWFRVIKQGGYLILVVPHQYLYERKRVLPSRWNQEHQRFYTPASLLKELESALAMNTYRIRSLSDNDENFNYTVSEYQHATGCYEIELVIEKLADKPIVDIDLNHLESELLQQYVTDVIICGAGVIGEDVYQLTQKLNIHVHEITDKNVRKLANGITTITLESLNSPQCVDFIVASIAYKNDIVDALNSMAARCDLAIRIHSV